MIHTDILIIGAGLSGLLTASLLQQRRPGLRITILEARPKAGGRIRTLRAENTAPLEMGATWLTNDHPRLMALLNRLGLDVMPQYTGPEAVYEFSAAQAPQRVQLPPGESQSYRVKGGTDQIISALLKEFGPEQLICSSPVHSVSAQPSAGKESDGHGGLEVRTPDAVYSAALVISTLPPRLLANSVTFDPSLPEPFMRIASQTHTWMSDSVKAGFTYAGADPFWLKPGATGTLFSNAGPLTEFYDHSQNGHHALAGFMHPDMAGQTTETRKKLALGQLTRLLGKPASDYQSYAECIWKDEVFTHSPHAGFLVPHQNSGHPVYREPLMKGRLILAGTETAASHPGYMEGAVESAGRAANSVFEYLGTSA
ncbi:MAG: FAD-dependent oxidoreductase [Balneolales bacterium]|nr:FAD-dependent oxidoreductase [Balneolales bacterium]